MLRVLVELGPLRIHSYGFMLMAAFALGILLAVRRAGRRGIPSEQILDLSTQIVIAAIVGSRFLYVVTHLDAYSGRWVDVFRVWEGGLTVYGGALVAVLVSVWFCRRRGLAFFRVADALAPSLALGVGITRVGCFLNGCCFGKACDLPWAVRFPEGSLSYFALGDASLHPSQLYASAVGFAVFFILLRMDRSRRAEGFLFWLFVLLLGGGTFLTDFTRHWETGAVVIGGGSTGLSLNQVVEAGLVVVSAVRLTMTGERQRVRGGEGKDEST